MNMQHIDIDIKNLNKMYIILQTAIKQHRLCRFTQLYSRMYQIFTHT